MSNLFNKAAVFTDIHLGLKNNSVVHNTDCENFIDWYIKTAKEHHCDTGLFLGDFHHNRNSLNITTMNTSIRILEKLGKAFDQFFFFVGNHDIFFKDKRDVFSIEFGKHIPGITIIDQPTTIRDVVLCPWLIGDEWSYVPRQDAKYIFGHFELPFFYMNAMVQMPDQGELKLEHFKNYDLAFSGHFHKRQNKHNIHYIGNCFPHNFSDVKDDKRGCMILEWGKEPIFLTWLQQPMYASYMLSELLESSNLLIPNSYVKIHLDVNLSYEEATMIKESFMEEYNLREVSLIPMKIDVSTQYTNANVQIESIDSIITSQITNLDSDFYNPNLLLQIYESLS